MSEQQCQGATIGFPLKLNRNVFDSGWLNATHAERQKLISPIDFEVNWASPGYMSIKSVSDISRFQVTGIDNYTNQTTITYGKGSDVSTYTALPRISLTNIQHAALVNQGHSPSQEVTLAFTINSSSKTRNPSAPDIVLLCRPIVLQSGVNPVGSFWKGVNDSAKGDGSNQIVNVDLSSIYTYGGTDPILQTMMTYETCIPTQFIGYGQVPKVGSILVRVHVMNNPLYIFSDTSGTGKCSSIRNYVFPGEVSRMIPFNGYTGIQFSTGMAANGSGYEFPDAKSMNPGLTPLASSAMISDWPDVLKQLEFLIPEAFLGKSLADLEKSTVVPVKKTVRKNFKCYTIDPKKDIVDGQIIIDPQTGESLKDTLTQDALDSSGGDPALAAALAGQAVGQSGIMPGDVEEAIFITISTLGAIFLVGYFFYVCRLFMDDVPGKLNHLLYLIMAVGILVGIIIALAKDLDDKGVKL